MRYFIQIQHPGLNKFQTIYGQTPQDVNARANAKLAQWESQYQRQIERDKRKADIEARREELNANKEDADEQTENARAQVSDLENLLQSIING